MTVDDGRSIPSATALTRVQGSPSAEPGSKVRGGVRLRERNCSLARTVAILSDAWTFLIIREAFFGARRFESFRSALGLPRATLTDRLRRLTEQGIFRQLQYSKTSRRVEYRLTEAGLDLYASFAAMMRFGDRWLANGKPQPLDLVHAACGCTCKPIVACSFCREPVSAHEVSACPGPGAGTSLTRQARRVRRLSGSTQFLRGRPSSVSRTLEIIGDRWTALILREAFFGLCRFDRLLAELNIASNILSDRLNRLVAAGIFERRKYQTQPDRYEYCLTGKGLELYRPLIVMMAWGDRWLSAGKPPVRLTHERCSQDFTPVVVCDHCRQPVDAQSMRFVLNYDPRAFGAPALSDRAADLGGH